MNKFIDNCYIEDLTPEGLNIKFISGYFIVGDSNFIIVEEGCESSLSKIISTLKKLGYRDQFLHLYVTHIHLDHAGSVGSLLTSFKKSKAYLHPRGVKHLVDPSKLWEASKRSLGYIAEIYGKPRPAPEDKLYPVEDGWIHEVEDNRFKFIYTEGHASHHLSIYWENENAMFVGDSAGIFINELNYIIPGTIYPVKLDLYVSSLEKMIRHNPKYLMYPHYGVVEDGRRVLYDHLKQVREYFNIAKKLSDSERNLDAYISLLSERENKLKRLVDYSREYPMIKILLELSFLGILKESERLNSI